MPTGREAKSSCKPCRERHIKCDRAIPVCSSCQRSKYLVDCSYETTKFIRFKTRRMPSPRVNTNRDNTSSDPSDPSRSSDSVNAPASAQPDPPGGLSPDQAGRDETIAPSGPNDVWGVPQQSPSSASTAVSRRSPWPCDPASNDHAGGQHEQSPAFVSEATQLSISPSPSESNYNIHSSAEAHIFGFYIDIAGPWLDDVSPHRYFGVNVPYMAGKEPVLLSACLAYSSRVLHLQGKIPSNIHEELQDRALRDLIPIVSAYRQGGNLDHKLDPILGTTVLLRMAEQFLELDEDQQHHLYGSSTLFETGHKEWCLYDDSLASASFWAYLRGSIRISFMMERPCPFELDRFTTWETASRDSTLTDECRANIMTYLMAEICTVCWGETSATGDGASRLTHLQSVVAEWKRHLPASFEPWYTQFGDDDVFPNVRYLARWHCVAWQFYYAAQVVLAAHLSTAGQGGIGMFGLARLLEENVTAPTRWLCGVTKSSPDVGVKINGSHLVAWSAQFITGKAEQGEVLDMLYSLWVESKWPNLTCHARLKGLWSGTRRSWVAE